MRFAKKVIIPVDFTDQLPALLKPLHEMAFLEHSEIHFVHVFPTITYPVFFGDFPMVYPITADLKVMEESGHSFLVNMTEKVLPNNFKGKVIHRILSSDEPKRKLSNYAKEEKADLIIIPTRSKHGIFDSSFAQYVNKHTHCNVLLIKHES